MCLPAGFFRGDRLVNDGGANQRLDRSPAVILSVPVVDMWTRHARRSTHHLAGVAVDIPSPLGRYSFYGAQPIEVSRAAYGHETWYQDLTLTAIKIWESWNKSLRDRTVLPPGMTPQERIYVNCGNYRFNDEQADTGLNPFEKASVENITRAGLGHTQYLFAEREEDVTRAQRDGFGHAVDPFHLASASEGAKKHTGYLDAIGGFVYADKACRYALHLAGKLGVKFFLDRVAGQFEGFREDT